MPRFSGRLRGLTILRVVGVSSGSTAPARVIFDDLNFYPGIIDTLTAQHLARGASTFTSSSLPRRAIKRGFARFEERVISADTSGWIISAG